MCLRRKLYLQLSRARLTVIVECELTRHLMLASSNLATAAFVEQNFSAFSDLRKSSWKLFSVENEYSSLIVNVPDAKNVKGSDAGTSTTVRFLQSRFDGVVIQACLPLDLQKHVCGDGDANEQLEELVDMLTKVADAKASLMKSRLHNRTKSITCGI